MSLHTVFLFADICDHDFMEMTNPENEWDPQTCAGAFNEYILPVQSCTRSIT